MPFGVRKNSKGTYDVIKRLPGGRTQKVAESKTKRNAQASARIRDTASRDVPRRQRR